MMKRREFFGWVGIGWLASFLPLALAGCNRQTPQNLSTNNT
ncbi:hypothetical protein PCC7424_4634 [Gloeothece citriformis PCC 7424]|uniref:Uncharacterized protein n=1 Tax=Gloeothece citriformis (strain PCC 7424) TaxID=65393 RepID=B7KBL8_GLOC7|nr:hypothetical protein [Gloeothece citriformis]ACK72996.1 hypothetical protein PCC7424_4634 [Gloeothece citriformis PCC 7424]